MFAEHHSPRAAVAADAVSFAHAETRVVSCNAEATMHETMDIRQRLPASLRDGEEWSVDAANEFSERCIRAARRLKTLHHGELHLP